MSSQRSVSVLRWSMHRPAAAVIYIPLMLPGPVQLHKEVQESLGQLRAIQAELRSGVSLVNPG